MNSNHRWVLVIIVSAVLLIGGVCAYIYYEVSNASFEVEASPIIVEILSSELTSDNSGTGKALSSGPLFAEAENDSIPIFTFDDPDHISDLAIVTGIVATVGDNGGIIQAYYDEGLLHRSPFFYNSGDSIEILHRQPRTVNAFGIQVVRALEESDDQKLVVVWLPFRNIIVP